MVNIYYVATKYPIPKTAEKQIETWTDMQVQYNSTIILGLNICISICDVLMCLYPHLSKYQCFLKPSQVSDSTLPVLLRWCF